MTQSLYSELQEARREIKAGRRAQARQILDRLARSNPNNHRVWLLMAAASESAAESLEHAQMALKISPSDPTARAAADWAQERLRAESTGSSPADERWAMHRRAGASSPDHVSERRASRRQGRRVRRYWTWAAGSLLGVLLAAVVILLALNLRIQPESLATQEVASVADRQVDPTPTKIAVIAQPTSVPKMAIATETIAPDSTATSNPIQPKEITSGKSGPQFTWTPTPRPTETPTPSPTWAPTFASPLTEANLLKPLGLAPNERWIDVSLDQQKLVAYQGNLPVFESLVSTGRWQYPTVTGQFRIWLRFPSQDMNGFRLGYDYYLRDVPYVQYFYQDYALHGTYWHNNFGTPMSHGCVNLPTPAAEWLYNWAEYGTLVSIHQ